MAPPAAGSKRYAALDCGTNTIRLYVADVAPDGSVTRITRQTEIVRLGQGVDETGELHPEALERTLQAAQRYGAELRRLKPDAIRFVATSATRDARNGHEFVDGIKAAIGVEPEVISGAEEAALAFDGATSWLLTKFPAPYLVVDLGGGSTELVLGGLGQPDDAGAGVVDGALMPQGTDSTAAQVPKVWAAYSMDVGSVRLTERRLKQDPPTEPEIELARADTDAMIKKAKAIVPIEKTRTIVGVAGTVTTLAAYHLGLKQYSAEAVNGLALTPVQIQKDCQAMFQMTKQQRLDLGIMQPGRADIIGAGAVIWSEVVKQVTDAAVAANHEPPMVVASDFDMLDGIVAGLARGGSATPANVRG